MAKRGKKKDTPAPEPETTTAAAVDVPDEGPQGSLPEYPHCACGAVLATEDEKRLNLCEDCGHLGGDGKLYATAGEAARASFEAGDDVPGLTPELATRINAFAEKHAADFKRICDSGADPHDLNAWQAFDDEQTAFVDSLPDDFPLDAQDILEAIEAGTWTPLMVKAQAPEEGSVSTEGAAPEGPSPAPAASPSEPVQQSLLPADPFDEHAAFEDMTAKAAAVEHLQKLYEEKKQQAADVKKQLEAAETLYQQIGIEYRRKERAWREQQEREAAAQRAYLEKLEADAAAKAQGQLPIGEADQVVSNPPSEADSVRQSAEPTPVAPLGGAVGSISDSLPKCPCGNTLATNEEAARKTCDECDRLTDEENARATDAAEMQLPPGV